jgi:SNF2 family DNA or RNA helicase
MGYKWKTKPYVHQVKAIKSLLRRGWGGALLMEPRTGKTKTTIDYASILAMQGKIDRMVVICPARVMDVWVAEFARHSPLNVHVVVWDSQARQHPIPKINPAYDLTVLVTNFEAFATPGPRTRSGARSKTRGRFKNRDNLRRWLNKQPALGVVDESHRIKSPSGKSSTMIVSMHNDFTYRMILTGTPVTKAKRAFDIYMQWKFLNPERFNDLTTIEDFRNHYGRFIQKNGYLEFKGQRNVDELKKRIHEDSFSVKREECFDLPPREDIVIKVDLISSAYAYDELAEHMVAEVEEMQDLKRIPLFKQTANERKRIHTIEASIRLVLDLRLSQLTGGCVTTDKGERIRVGSEKLKVLRELLEDIFEKEEKVVVPARFTMDLTAIERMGHELSVPTFRLSGGVSRSDSTQAIDDFKKTDGPALFVVQPAAGSLGIDLSSASHMIWYSLTNSWTDFTQCSDRIALSRNSTTFMYLLAKGTIDETMYKGLKADGKVAEMIMTKPERILRSTRYA